VTGYAILVTGVKLPEACAWSRMPGVPAPASGHACPGVSNGVRAPCHQGQVTESLWPASRHWRLATRAQA